MSKLSIFVKASFPSLDLFWQSKNINKAMEKIFQSELIKGVCRKPIETLTSLENLSDKYGRLNKEGLAKFGEFKWADYLFKCQVESCGIEIKEFEVLQEHYEAVHETPIIYNCMDCPKTFQSLASFMNHVFRHRENLKFCCIYCSCYYSDVMLLYKHQAKKHRRETTKVYPCLYCSHVLR